MVELLIIIRVHVGATVPMKVGRFVIITHWRLICDCLVVYTAGVHPPAYISRGVVTLRRLTLRVYNVLDQILTGFNIGHTTARYHGRDMETYGVFSIALCGGNCIIRLSLFDHGSRMDRVITVN